MLTDGAKRTKAFATWWLRTIGVLQLFRRKTSSMTERIEWFPRIVTWWHFEIIRTYRGSEVAIRPHHYYSRKLNGVVLSSTIIVSQSTSTIIAWPNDDRGSLKFYMEMSHGWNSLFCHRIYFSSFSRHLSSLESSVTKCHQARVMTLWFYPNHIASSSVSRIFAFSWTSH